MPARSIFISVFNIVAYHFHRDYYFVMANGIAFERVACPWHTLAVSRRPAKEGGLAREQAEAIASAIGEANAGKLDKAVLDNLATKTDLAQMETRMTRWFIATILTIIGVIVALAVGAATVLAPYLNILFKLGSLVQN